MTLMTILVKRKEISNGVVATVFSVLVVSVDLAVLSINYGKVTTETLPVALSKTAVVLSVLNGS